MAGKVTRSILERFWDKVEHCEAGKCWPWIAARQHQGYGAFWMGGRMVPAHRAAYMLLVGPIPDGLVIDHLCRNQACVNPAHMEPVTNAENLRRGNPGAPALMAAKTHCKFGHPLSGENVYEHSFRLHGRRQCKTCSRARARAQRERVIAAR